MSVPVTVNSVDDKSPEPEVKETLPFNDVWDVGVPREVPEVTDELE